MPLIVVMGIKLLEMATFVIVITIILTCCVDVKFVYLL
jgi:hypothetical protein